MADSKIIQRCLDLGVDHARLKRCLDSRDNWGALAHAFEYLTVLNAVEQAMREDDNRNGEAQ